MPAASAILRTVVALYPCSAKTSAAMARSSRRRSGEGLTAAFFFVVLPCFFVVLLCSVVVLLCFGFDTRSFSA
ncbi:hypothetical protein GCM10010449_26350 [Streptomyces rectiviolaceus]|uniref:Uncharacterized protein n=1 Tax=Streptomyces rectiviolaceus TaxID=332591 RepID=A0ABP6MFM5_9ACTN